ncbi:WhiB family transcriptional regulator [Rhodococcus koreensis]|uniref:WhiB family transcriptional regulator n=1 Tax=Rhodococcus koreensis TaxID=99653 RepID=UPI0036732327
MSASLTAHPYAPSTEMWDWQLHARCRDMDTDLFFSPDGETRQARRYREEFVTQICHSCPVVSECHTYAQTVREPYGIWGGATEADRRFSTARTPRQQPGTSTATGSAARRLTVSSRHPRPGRQERSGDAAD